MNGLFEIHPDTGVVTVMDNIDREDLLDVGATVKLTVKVTILPTLYQPYNPYSNCKCQCSALHLVSVHYDLQVFNV